MRGNKFMFKYHFYSYLTIHEIESKISDLPNIKFSSVLNSGFIGEISKHRIYIGYVPNTMTTNINFFCGKMTPLKEGTLISGRFTYPLKLVVFSQALFCFISLLLGKLNGLIAGVVACVSVNGINTLLLSLPTQSQKKIVHFITNNLESEMLQSKDGPVIYHEMRNK